MLLAIDIGNTNLTLGLYEQEKLSKSWRLSTDLQRMPDEYGLQILSLLQICECEPKQLKGLVLCSVVPTISERIIQACRQYLGTDPFIINHKLETGVKILYENPDGVGADRIADAAAVYHLYGGPACVIDFGTATTFNALTARGEYLGGAIAPGIGIASEALFNRTAKLAPVALNKPPNPIGRNTVHAIQSGLLFGYIGLVEGMVKRFRQELGEKTRVIATGGLANVIAPETKAIDIIAPWLTLDGLRIIWELNQK
ncbi:MAG: type III pantothenate kinase [Anaerolineaceae bacterium]|nr:type III pantothenate kinase [Anaerolineaceae bacterium]